MMAERCLILMGFALAAVFYLKGNTVLSQSATSRLTLALGRRRVPLHVGQERKLATLLLRKTYGCWMRRAVFRQTKIDRRLLFLAPARVAEKTMP